MKKSNALILSSLSLPLLLAACQSQDEQSIQEPSQHTTIKITEEDMVDAYNNKDAFKKTVSIGTSEVTLPLQGLYFKEN